MQVEGGGFGGGDLAENVCNIAANSPHIVDCEDSDFDGMYLVVVLFEDRQALLVAVIGEIDIGLVELHGFDV